LVHPEVTPFSFSTEDGTHPVFVMPPDYQSRVSPDDWENQTVPPRLIIECSNGKVYLWGGHEIEKALVKALVRR
jgi:hypothetical protein